MPPYEPQTSVPKNREYGAWINMDVCQRAGIPTGSYDITPAFEDLNPENQRIVAEYIALQGGNIVTAAGLTAFVEEQRIPVAGIEAHTR